MSWLLSAGSLEDEVFCERTGKWADHEEGTARVMVPETAEELEAMRPENLTLPLDLPPVQRGKKVHVRYDSWVGPAGSDLYVINANVVEYTRDDDGDLDEDEEELGYQCIVSREMVEALRNWTGPVVEDSEDEETATEEEA